MNPEKILKKYRKLLSELCGENIAKKSDCYYRGGWYYINIAKRFGDGKIGMHGIPNCYREREILKMIEKRSLFKVR